MNLKQNWPIAVFIVIFLFTFIDRGGIPFLSHAVAAVLLGLTTIVFHFLKKERERFTWPELFFLLYIIWFALSLIFSEAREYGFTELLSLIIGYLVFSFAVHGGFSRVSSRTWKYIFGGVIGSTVLIGIYAFVFLPFDRFTGPFLNFQKLYEAYPNDFASIALMAIPFSFFFLFKSETSRERKFFLFFSGLLLSVLFLTLSRGAWAAFLAAVIFALIIGYLVKFPSRLKEFFRTVTICLLIFIVSTGALLFARSQYEKLARFTDRFSGYEGGSGIHDRLEFWGAAFGMVKTAPIFGHGPVSFKFLFPQYQKTFGIAQDQPHNFYLKTAVENGIPALFFFLTFLFVLGLPAFKEFRRIHDPFLFTLFISATTVLFQNFVDDTLNFVSNGIFFFAVLGFIFYLSKEKQKYLNLKISPQWIFMVISLIIIPITFHEFWYNISFKEGKSLAAQGVTGGAFVKFEEAKKLYFERDLKIHIFDNYEKIYEKSENPDILSTWKLESWRALEKGPPWDYGDRAEILFSQGKARQLSLQKPEALAAFHRAVLYDPKNFLKYHYFYQHTLADVKQPLEIKLIKSLLADYIQLLKKNAHFTVTSENPFYAAKLYELLIKYPESPIAQEAYEFEYELYKKFWKKEREKFARIYHANQDEILDSRFTK